MLEAIYEWGSLTVAAISTALAIIVYIKGKKKNANNQEISEEISKLREVNKIAKVLQQIPDLINKAEKTFASNGNIKFGPAKLAWVLGEVEKLCLKMDIEYNEEQYTYEVEKILSTPQKGGKENENASC